MDPSPCFERNHSRFLATEDAVYRRGEEPKERLSTELQRQVGSRREPASKIRCQLLLADLNRSDGQRSCRRDLLAATLT